MSSSVRSIAVVGLPGVGKTTFLAALWEVVSTGEVAGSLQLDHLEGDKHHLNEIRNRWADCQQIERTRIPDETLVNMWLKDDVSQVAGEIVFTDMSGESFEQQWLERTCKESYQTLIRQASGILLLIHPRKVKECTLIRDAAQVLEAIPQPDVDTLPSASGRDPVVTAANPLPTEPKYASTQVQLVELLQFIQHLRGAEANKIRLGIMISAWDVVENLQAKGKRQTPREWFSGRLPMLDQFVRANSDGFECEVFGVSAQGGELKDVVTLRKQMPYERIAVLHEMNRSHDITLPARWVLGLNDKPAEATAKD